MKKHITVLLLLLATNAQAGEEISAASGDLIARIDGKPGNYVEFERPQHKGDEPSILIAATFPESPLVDPEFAAASSALRIFLAIADPAQPVPDALLRTASEQDLALLSDHQSLVALKETHMRLLEAFEPVETREPSPPLGRAASTCSSSFKSWVKRVYGEGFGDTKTCTDNSGFSQRSWPTYYCDPGPGNDCSYRIGGLDRCYPAGDPTCSVFSGSLKVHRARFALSGGGTFRYNMSGHRYRFGVANCHGANGSMIMQRKRGNGSWITQEVPAGTMYYWFAGGSDPRPRANPTWGVAYGIWKQVVPQSGNSYKFNQLRVFKQPYQRGYACGDVMRRFETFDITPPSCNFRRDFCKSDESCDGACWN